MQPISLRVLLTLGTLLLVAASSASSQATPKLPHDSWDRLLKRYVREDHRVDYARWKREGLGELDAYVGSLAKTFPAGTTATERNAALTNAYNALTIRWVLQHFPVKSIWKTKQPFTGRRHTVDGKTVSLDDIETELRKTMGPRTHAVLVCAARSCPPLRREAYVAERLETQLDANTREWLANEQFNRFFPEKNEAALSKIFEWYRGDFDANGGTLETFLARYAPDGKGTFLTAGNKPKLEFLDYNWGLNDTGDVGKGYSGFAFSFDYLRNK